MKKICIVSFFHVEVSLCLAKYLAKQGVSVDIYMLADLLRDKGFMPGIEYKKAPKKLGIIELNHDNCPITVDDSNGLPIRYYLLRVLSYSPKLYWADKLILKNAIRQIRKNHYDAVNIVGQVPLVECIYDSFKGENVVQTLHELPSHSGDGKTTPLIQKLIDDKTKTIFLSNSTRNRFLSIKGGCGIPTETIPMGKFESQLLYEKDLHLDLGLKANVPTLLFYGFIKPYKGLDILAEAYRALGDFTDKFNLIIAGSGYDENLDFFKNEEKVIVLNHFLTDEEMLYLNRISDVVLLPYKSASQSGIVLTSFLFGNPIIATKVGALVETIKDGKNGLLVEPNNPKKYAEVMKRLVSDASLLNHLKEGALQFGHGDEYDWSNIAQKTLDFYFK